MSPVIPVIILYYKEEILVFAVIIINILNILSLQLLVFSVMIVAILVKGLLTVTA